MSNREERRNLKKGKLAVVAVIVLIILAIVLISVFSKKGEEENPIEINEEYEEYSLPSTTYNNMEVKDISMEYRKESNETIVNLVFENVTDKTVQAENVAVYLLDKNGNILGSTSTTFSDIEPGGMHAISNVFDDDLTATASVKLEKKEGTVVSNGTETKSTNEVN